MADTTALKNRIRAAIKANDNQEITGPVLQQALLDMVDELNGATETEASARQSGDNTLQQNLNTETQQRQSGDNTLQQNLNTETQQRQEADTQLNNLITGIKNNIDNGYVYAGIATPSTTPASGKVFYLALTAGTYTNFGATVVPQGINILKYNGSAWSLDSFLGLDDAPTQGSSNLVKSGGVLDSIIKDGSAFDLSAYNNGTTYANLTAALTALDTLSADYKRGGMSIKFVLSSDNNYVKCSLMANEFTTDTTQWAIADEGVYVESSEFVYVKTDKDDEILWAIKTDGSIYYGAGVPPQIIDYINKKIAELSLDEYEDIVAFLANLEKGDETLQDLLDKKVDGEYIENPEYIEAKTDAEDKILEATEKDGTKVFGSVKVLGSIKISDIEYKVVSSPEWFEVVLDAEDKIICGIRTNGKFEVYAADFLDDIEDIKTRLKELDAYSVTENPEFLEVTTDPEDKVIEGIREDGTKVIGGDLEVGSNTTIDGDIKVHGNMDVSGISYKVIENPEYLEAKTDSESKLLAGRTSDGAAFENIGFSTPSLSIDGHTIENSEDPEGRSEITTDVDDRIISYRDSEGVKHEEVGIESAVVKTNSLNLTTEGMHEFQKALKDSGFQPGGSGDYTDKETMYIPEPMLAHLNILTDFDLTTLTKSSDVKCLVEFTDGVGNYFKKWVILNGQGRSSLSFPKKGLGMDFFNENPNDENFNEDNVFEMRFGDWIPQDSFHIKSFYTEPTRCASPICYKLMKEFVSTRNILEDRPYKKYYVGNYTDSGSSASSLSDIDKNFETGAWCIPDGFPVIVYQNGEFWGVNSWQLKKHRDNYQLSKKKATNIHLDGDMGTRPIGGVSHEPFWLWNGTILWNVYCDEWAGIETRNPKNLYCVDGKKYNVDTHNIEIIDTATAEEWIAAGQIIPTGKTIDSELAGYLRTTGKVRTSIEALTTYIPTLREMESQGATAQEMREAISDRFDVDSFIDYIILGQVVYNGDGWDNNGQIITWGAINGSQNLNWSVNIWDCDSVFGNAFNGVVASGASNNKSGRNTPLYSIFWDYYLDDMKIRYAELRNKKIIDADHIINLFRNWMNRVGIANYEKEFEKWSESPCFRDGTQTYPNNPTTGGYYGSIYRIYLWLKKRIQYMDAADFFDYNN